MNREATRDPVRRRAWIAATKETARQFLAGVRATTVCIQCGAGLVDFHREEHEQFPHWRVAYLAAQGRSIKRIKAEIAKCKALCRRCHMREDGRMAALAANHQLWQERLAQGARRTDG